MIERARFGATGHESSRVVFGAAALGDVSKADADRTLDVLLEHGVNHIDVAAAYGDAELRVAAWLAREPGTFFLATKTGQRTYRAARDSIHRSLDRLGVDRVDSIQLHNLVDIIEWETALGAGGALEAAVEAREEGLVRFIGVAGDGPSVPGLARRRWDGRKATAATWYEPLTEQADIDLAVAWVLGRPEVFLLTTGDVDVLPKLLDAAERAGRAAHRTGRRPRGPARARCPARRPRPGRRAPAARTRPR